jgi:hypothetical protein
MAGLLHAAVERPNAYGSIIRAQIVKRQSFVCFFHRH